MLKWKLKIMEYHYGPFRIRKVKDLWYFHRIGEPVMEYGKSYTSMENAIKGIHDNEPEFRAKVPERERYNGGH